MDFPEMVPGYRSGFVALVGRPNAGKSTLINTLLGKKIAITSNTAQTTRHRLRAVLSKESFQIIFVDTPGLHKPHDALGEELNVSAPKALEDVDIAVMVIDGTQTIGRGDEWVASHVQKSSAKKLCVINKLDRLNPQKLADQKTAAASLGSWDAILEISAKTGEGIDAFLDVVVRELAEGPPWFPADMDTDQPLEVMIAEFIREKILRTFYDEVPHAIGVSVEEMSYDQQRDLYRIYAVIYVERTSQKGIIVGKGGKAIKEIGIQARKDLESLLASQVFLDLRVKLKKNWRRDAAQIRRFGYGEGA